MVERRGRVVVELLLNILREKFTLSKVERLGEDVWEESFQRLFRI